MRKSSNLFFCNRINSITLLIFIPLLWISSVVSGAELSVVLSSFSNGNLDKVVTDWQNLDEVEKLSETGQKVKSIVDSYEQLVKDMEQARQQEYDKLVAEMKTSLQKAKWQDSLLEISQKYDFESEEKTKLEKQLSEESDKFWLEALADLFEIHAFCERMDSEKDIDPTVSQSIIDKGFEIGSRFESEGKELEAYSKAYAYIGELTNQPNKYDDMHDILQRKAIIESTYVDDPNSESITWQERRKEISLDIIELALSEMSSNYVEIPNFKEMLLKGLDYCLLLTQTDNLEKTFAKLKDDDTKSIFNLRIKSLIRKIRELPVEQCNFSKCREVINEVLSINKTTLEFPMNVILAEFAEGLFDAVDTYTYIIWPQAVEDFRKTMTNVFSGIGVVIKKNEEGYIEAESLISYDSPACKAGLDAKDVIMAVDGRDTKDMTTERAIDFITGPDGSDVILTVMRKGFDTPRDFTVTRRQIYVPTVKGLTRDIMGNWEYFLDTDRTIGYLRVTSFSGETSLHLLQDMARLKSQGMKAMVLDLRNNSGGYLETALEMVNLFLREGVIVSIKNRADGGYVEEDIKMARPSKNFDPDMPLVVLINSASASASEIVSGSLKDHGRAIIVGARSYGKGSVQNVKRLGLTDAEIKLTIAKYYLPSGRSLSRDFKDKLNKDYGVEPDVKVELTVEQIKEWAKAVRESDTLHRPDIPREERYWDIWTVDEVLAADQQLNAAKLVLEGNLLGKN